MPANILTEAQLYAKHGFSVIPVRHGDKRPAIAWDQYQKRAPTVEQVTQWFSNGNYTALGIITGTVSNGLVILDFDGEGWERARDDILAQYPNLKDTRHVRTGSGKLHIYLCADDLSNGSGRPLTQQVFKRSDLGKDTAIEVRGNDMQTLAPPSLHPSGGYYEVINDADILRVADLHAMMAWLKQWAQGNKASGKQPAPTDDELADRWIEAHDQTAHGLNEWRRYESGYWPIIAEDEVNAEVLGICKVAKSEGIRPSKARVSSVAELARFMIYVPTHKWDSVSQNIVLQNGTLDLKTLQLREHSPQDYATRTLQYDYDPQATAPYFDYALHSTIPEAVEFFQEFAGYCLTADTSLETAVWFYGPPGSGKSTLLHGLTTMMGDLAGLLSLAQIERSQFALANLPGKRLVMSTEQPSMYLRSTWILNALISGETVTIEQKNQKAYTIIPQAKVAFAMNDLPKVSDASNGLFRRVKVIKFPLLREEDRNETLKFLISKEAPGILNWAIEGLQRLRTRKKFDVPQSVRDATEDFKRENDKAAMFLEECCVVDAEARTQSQLLYEHYKTWCLDNGHRVESSTSMAGEWRRLGFEKKRISGKSWWQGVGFLVQV